MDKNPLNFINQSSADGLFGAADRFTLKVREGVNHPCVAKAAGALKTFCGSDFFSFSVEGDIRVANLCHDIRSSFHS
ncbi:hypothetical protein [Neorhodopirellula pilleata]|uniref:Uncharacterized protein n=1 Tax=Neorhodopirellula pilleata TaxID=2714738 RepID=A0A5C5ZXN3_9BACT|nr:hypothetical protein [Neorhodopirellula pilleata]TWT91906.1 hypothetical protein Pla100_49460 [Neorhodopirellula pilleata]